MRDSGVTITVRKESSDVGVLDVRGVLSAEAEPAAVDALGAALGAGVRRLALNLAGLERMDAGGAGLLAKLASWADQRGLGIGAFGVNALYRRVLRVTRLDEAVRLFDSEAQVLGRPAGVEPAPLEPPPGEEERWARSAPGPDARAPAVPEGALGLNVAGRRAVGPLQGFGALWQKSHRIRLSGAVVGAAEVVGVWRERFGSFWPEGNRVFAGSAGLSPGEVAVLNLTMPGGVPLSTGVLVVHGDEGSFTFMTLEGHLQAGWITFRAFEEEGAVVAEVRSLSCSGDPLYEAGFSVMGHRQQEEFWHRTLEALAAHFGVKGLPQTFTVCVDPRRKWGNAAGTRLNAGVLTAFHAAAGLVGRAFRSAARPA